jgi:PAS domain S-box-containing protein
MRRMDPEGPPMTAAVTGDKQERGASSGAASVGRRRRGPSSRRRGPSSRRGDGDAPSQGQGPVRGSKGGEDAVDLATELTSVVRLTEAMPVAIYAKDRSGTFIAANALLLRLFGLGPRDVVGRRPEDVLPLHLAQEDEELDALLLAGQSPQPIHLIWTTPDGGMQTLEGYKSELKRPKDGVVGTLTIIWDASERLGSEEALRQSEARFRTFFQACPMPLLELEFSSTMAYVRDLSVAEGRDIASCLATSPADVDEAATRLGITAFNGALLTLLGARSFEGVDRILHENLVLHARDAFVKLLVDLSAGSRRVTTEATVRGVDESPHQVSIELSKVPGDEDGTVRGIVCITDLTEAREREVQFLEERRRSRLYLDLLVHDVRNLTQGMLTSLELISSGTRVTPHTASLVRRARSHAERIAELVTKVSLISTISPEMPGVRLIDLTSIVWMAVDRACVSHRGRELVVNFMPPKGKALVQANDVLEDAVSGLLDNAIRATRTGRTEVDIELNPSDDGRRWRLAIKDRGPGVPDQAKADVFGRYARSGEWEPGSDLGMAFVEHLVICLGGGLSVEDRVRGEPSMGSSFVMELPAAL